MSIIEKYFKEGRLQVIPKKQESKIEILLYFIEILKNKGKTIFSERELNEIISEVYSDYALIRRYLIDYGFLIRDKYGREYRIKEKYDESNSI